MPGDVTHFNKAVCFKCWCFTYLTPSPTLLIWTFVEIVIWSTFQTVHACISYGWKWTSVAEFKQNWLRIKHDLLLVHQGFRCHNGVSNKVGLWHNRYKNGISAKYAIKEIKLGVVGFCKMWILIMLPTIERNMFSSSGLTLKMKTTVFFQKNSNTAHC